MRNWMTLAEKLIFPGYDFLNPSDWQKTVVCINPSKSEFWSNNFRQTKEGAVAETPSAAGVLLKDGNIVVGDGHSLSHEDICNIAGLEIDNELFRLQIWKGKVLIEIWVDEERATSKSSLDEKIKAAEEQYGMSLEDMRTIVARATTRFVPGWKVVCGLWTDGSKLTEV